MSASHPNGSNAEDLCLACGLCCNGVIFADVKLRPGDNPARLQGLGLPLMRSGSSRRRLAQEASPRPIPAGRGLKFCQPCAAFDGCQCRIYADRPVYCREFDCLLLKDLRDGVTSRPAALGVIRTAKERADKVRELLWELGDTDKDLALAIRFRRTTKRLEGIGLDKFSSELYGRLTLAVHDLNFLLSETFYPG